MLKKIYSLLTSFFIRFFLFAMTKFWVDIKTKRLGSDYGGWNFIDKPYLKNTTIISAGCGEDVSFDIEFMNYYESNVIFIDPTPRSVDHLEKIKKNVGNDKTLDYINGGNQPIETYDLKNIDLSRFEVIKKALFNKDNLSIKFFPPLNPDHVSYSISNWQSNSKSSNNIIEVETVTVKKILQDYKINDFQLLKMDIEGAENQVIPYLIKNKIFPKQILVEFDELHTKKLLPYIKASIIIFKLIKNNYKLIKTPKFPDMLFLKNE